MTHYGDMAIRIAANVAVRTARQMQVALEQWSEKPQQEWYIDTQEVQRRLDSGDVEGVAQAIPEIMKQLHQQEQEPPDAS